MDKDTLSSIDLTSTNQFIPIFEDTISSFPNIYIYMTVMRNQMEEINFIFGNKTSTIILKLNDDFLTSREKTGMHRNNFNPVAKTIQLIQRIDGKHAALMPFAVWDAFNDYLNKFDVRSRNSLTRLFCYIYYNYDWRPYFYNSIENIAAETGIDHSDVSAKLISICNAGFIERGVYIPNDAARTYWIPEKHWSYNMNIKKKRDDKAN